MNNEFEYRFTAETNECPCKSNGNPDKSNMRPCQSNGGCSCHEKEGDKYIKFADGREVKLPKEGNEVFFVSMENDDWQFSINCSYWQNTPLMLYLFARGRIFDSWHEARMYLEECDCVAWSIREQVEPEQD